MQTLGDVTRWLQAAPEQELSMKTLCVREPWSAAAEARVVKVDEAGRLPRDVKASGLRYFLEATVAREVLDVLKTRPTASQPEDACRLLIYYAENDGYPPWVYT